jgi:hypothetical protein
MAFIKLVLQTGVRAYSSASPASPCRTAKILIWLAANGLEFHGPAFNASEGEIASEGAATARRALDAKPGVMALRHVLDDRQA